jgi:hypothetical protein
MGIYRELELKKNLISSQWFDIGESQKGGRMETSPRTNTTKGGWGLSALYLFSYMTATAVGVRTRRQGIAQ